VIDRPLLKLAPQSVFWMVWRSDSQRIRKRHPTEESALEEAKRLRGLFPTREFYVLKSVRKFGRGAAA
jgi:hypothetical protein